MNKYTILVGSFLVLLTTSCENKKSKAIDKRASKNGKIIETEDDSKNENEGTKNPPKRIDRETVEFNPAKIIEGEFKPLVEYKSFQGELTLDQIEAWVSADKTNRGDKAEDYKVFLYP